VFLPAIYPYELLMRIFYLGKDEATRPFYDAYQRDLVDDDPMEFGPREEEVGPIDGEEVVEETISRAEVTMRAREIARAREVS
jgi:hypothetical protein